MFRFLKPCFAAHCAFETVVPLVGGLEQAVPLSPRALCVLFCGPPL